ncbi:Ferritin-like domain-containing protein [Acidiphilium rubrum]|uniref:Ferritin-like domain-containing protein n=1 Tax=Acidiphilium rubrum TaxID=526 RepID=A0A8G2FEJ1_ACIRU|nr:Ferritin-like domain-containing protein [Acidiphilium rubrum]
MSDALLSQYRNVSNDGFACSFRRRLPLLAGILNGLHLSIHHIARHDLKNRIAGKQTVDEQVVLSGTDTQSQRPGRRQILRNSGMGASGLAALAGLTIAGTSADASSTTPIPGVTTNDYYNLALIQNIQYLEATYYLYAVTGQGLSAADTAGIGTAGTVTGGSAVPFRTSIIQQYANDIAADELTHVRTIHTESILNGFAMPDIDMRTAWTTMALAAGLIVPGQIFNPFADEISFMLGAFFLEDIAAAALCFAIESLSYNTNLTYLGALMGAESYHAGTIRTLLAKIGGGAVANKIAALRASLSGANDDSGILQPNGYVNVGPFSPQALLFRRSYAQTLNILFLSSGATSGGFFPNGVSPVFLPMALG